MKKFYLILPNSKVTCLGGFRKSPVHGWVSYFMPQTDPVCGLAGVWAPVSPSTVTIYPEFQPEHTPSGDVHSVHTPNGDVHSVPRHPEASSAPPWYTEHLPAVEYGTACRFPSGFFDDRGHGSFFLCSDLLPAAAWPGTQGIINNYQTTFLEQRAIILAG